MAVSLTEGNIQGGSLALEAGVGQGTVQGEIYTREGEVTLQGLASLGRGLEEVTVEGEIDLPDLGAFLHPTETDRPGGALRRIRTC